MTFLTILYVFVILYLSSFGLFQGTMLVLFFVQRRKSANERNGNTDASSAESGSLDTASREGTLPRVTVQLPVYNEKYVVERVVDAAANLDYPPELLDIQLLDDSTDNSIEVGRNAVEYHRANGVNIEFIHRDNRVGFKAGALAEGLERAKGELVAIFDADFIPKPDFLRRLIVTHGVFHDPEVGFVQTRWSFINRDESWLTKTQSVMHDMHFHIEQPARSRNGLFFNFNGSGGIWRRSCIEDAGGWSADTLAEDLDLSYRAELRGWRGMYFATETAPNELPTNMMAFKRQQTRWARGSIQCAKKLVPRFIAEPVSLGRKLGAIMHVSSYSLHLSLVMFVLLYPLIVLIPVYGGGNVEMPVWLNILSPLCLTYLVALTVPQILTRSFSSSIPFGIATAVLVGVGVSVNNAVAVLKGLFLKQSGVFERTPKDGVEPQNSARIAMKSRPGGNQYSLKPNRTVWMEFAMALYCLVAFMLMFRVVLFWAAPMLFYTLCYSTVAFSQIVQWNRIKPSGRVAEKTVDVSLRNAG